MAYESSINQRAPKSNARTGLGVGRGAWAVLVPPPTALGSCERSPRATISDGEPVLSRPQHLAVFLLSWSCLFACGGKTIVTAPDEPEKPSEPDDPDGPDDPDDPGGPDDPDEPDEDPLELEGAALTQVVTGERLCGLDGGGRVLCEGGGLPLDNPATQLTSTSPNHREDLLCALLDGGEVACTYPYFSAGFVGYQAIDLSLSYQTALIVTVEGQIVGSWGQQLSDKLYQDVAAGVGFGCAIDMSRGLTCFDFVNEAEIRRAPPGEYSIVFEVPDGHFTAVSASDQSGDAPFCVLDNVGQATCWWLRDAEGRPIDDPKDARAVEAFAPDSRFFELAIGLRETCGIDERRRVVCWEHSAASDSMPTLSTPLEALAFAIAVGTNGLDFCILDELGLPQCWTP